MKKSTLIWLSLAADILDIMVVGQVPVVSWFIDIPVISCQVLYAGPAGFLTMVELVPVVGTIPLFTAAALMHENHD